MQSYTYMWKAITARANQLLLIHTAITWVTTGAVMCESQLRFDCWDSWRLKKRLTWLRKEYVFHAACHRQIRLQRNAGWYFRNISIHLKQIEKQWTIDHRKDETLRHSCLHFSLSRIPVCDKVQISSLAANELATSAILLASSAWLLEDVAFIDVALNDKYVFIYYIRMTA